MQPNIFSITIVGMMCVTIIILALILSNLDKTQIDYSGSTNTKCAYSYLFDNAYDIQDTPEGGCKYRIAR